MLTSAAPPETAAQANSGMSVRTPPLEKTFSNSARADDFDTQRDHVRLLRAAMARLAPGGVLVFSNNYRRFRLDEAAVAEFAQAREITPETIAPDFARNPRIHRCWELRRP